MPKFPKVSKRNKKTPDWISKVSKTKDGTKNDKFKIPFEDMPTPPKFPNIKETPDLIGAKKKKTRSKFPKISTGMRILLSGFLAMHKFH